MHYECASHKVPQTAIFGVEQHSDNTYAIKAGEEIHYAQEIAGNGLKSINGASGIFNHADASPALARSLPLPKGLKRGEVAPENAEVSNDDDGPHPHPIGADAREQGAGQGGFVKYDQHQIHHDLANGVRKDGHNTAAEVGQAKFKVHLFRGINGKLVNRHDDFYLLVGKEKEPLASPGRSARSA